VTLFSLEFMAPLVLESLVPYIMTHVNQIGQTGATPRHPKGLSTCCHGEEPHAVGWRFITERRAVNLDPNCGWARGKADALYVADAFEVMLKVNALLGAKQARRTQRKGCRDREGELEISPLRQQRPPFHGTQLAEPRPLCTTKDLARRNRCA
jgi:hypothetical protein